MSDISFTEMGKALDAATQTRAPQTSVSSNTSASTEEKQSVSTPATQASGEGSPTPTSAQPSGGASSQPPKTDKSPSAVAEPNSDQPPTGPQGTPTATPDDKEARERRERNRWFAQQRIAAKEAKKKRFEEEKARLEKERDAYADETGKYHNPQMVDVKNDQLRELEIARIQEAQMEWEQEAYQLFSPEDAKTFIEDSKTLGQYLNDREPEILSYLDRPYGKHLLKGWMDKIAKNREAAARWKSLNSYEKSKILDSYYSQLEKFGNDYAEGKIDANGNPVNAGTPAPATPTQTPTQTPQPTPPQNVPVPGSGRDTNTMPPTNNFALALQDAMNKRHM